MSQTPRVSIGLPVYNGENYLAEALDTLLAQTFDDFELIISDNASTDGTAEICRRYAARDARIRYVRQPHNRGGSPNQNTVLELARGEYFKLAAHDDRYGPRLIETCVAALDADPDAVLCHTDMAYVDGAGEIISHYDYTMATGSPDPAERFRSLLVTDGGDDEYGVVRTEVLRRVTPLDSYHNPGRPYVAELVLHGPFRQVHELLYFRRDHPDRGDRSATVRALSARLDPLRQGQSTARLLAEYVRGYFLAVHRAPITPAQRRACYRHLVRWLAWPPEQPSRPRRTLGRKTWQPPEPRVELSSQRGVRYP